MGLFGRALDGCGKHDLSTTRRLRGACFYMSRLAKRTATVGGMTSVSRVLGLVRDVVIARTFGAAPEADAFFVAFRVPNLFRRWFGEGAFSQAFVPVLAEYRERFGRDDVEALVAAVTATLGLALALFTLVGIACAPWLVTLFSPGFLEEPEQHARATALLRLTFPYLLLICMVALSGALMNTWGRFAVPAFTPVLLNVGLIAGALWLAPQLESPVFGLAWGVLIGGVLQLLLQLPTLARLGLLLRPRFRPRHPGVRQIGRLMLPAVFGASVSQVNILIDTALASLLVSGSISWLYYADRMMEFPLGVFSIALGTVVLPSLSRAFQRGRHEDYARTLDWGLKLVCLVTVPAAVGLSVLATPILSTLFEYGAMGGQDVRAAAGALAAYGVGLVGLSFVKVLAPAYFARQDTRTPVRVALVAVGVNVGLNLLLIGPLAHVGLALATSVAACVNAGLLFRGLVRRGQYRPGADWAGLLGRVGVASVCMAVALRLAAPGHSVFSALDCWGRGAWLAGLVALGVLIYAAVLWLTGVRPRQYLNV